MKTHGLMYVNGKRRPEYGTWCNMRRRCYDKNHEQYHNYGSRGIVVCEAWNNSFRDFFQDMGERPSKKHSLDRIDNNGNYEPGNCRWATTKEQADNTRLTTRLELNGVTKTITEWAEHLGIKKSTLHARLFDGWSVGKTLRTPIVRRRSVHHLQHY